MLNIGIVNGGAWCSFLTYFCYFFAVLGQNLYFKNPVKYMRSFHVNHSCGAAPRAFLVYGQQLKALNAFSRQIGYISSTSNRGLGRLKTASVALTSAEADVQSNAKQRVLSPCPRGGRAGRKSRDLALRRRSGRTRGSRGYSSRRRRRRP